MPIVTVELSEITVLTDYKDILATSKGNALALDISPSSTGVAMLIDGKLTTKVISVPAPDKGDVFFNLNLAKAFISKLCEEIPRVHYETVAIEDIYGGAYVQTYRLLLSLAMGFDLYMQSGLFTYNSYMKLENRSWKSKLRRLAGVTGKQYLKDKEDIQRSLSELGVTKDTLTVKDRGLQDQFDAIGVLLVAITTEGTGHTEIKARYTLTIEFYTEEQLLSLKRKTKDIKSPYAANHTHTRKELLMLAEDDSVWYKIEVRTTGSLGIKKGFQETIGGPNYILFKKTKKKGSGTK